MRSAWCPTDPSCWNGWRKNLLRRRQTAGCWPSAASTTRIPPPPPTPPPPSIYPSAEALLTQEVYQILAGYPDHNDAQALRDDPLFQILADVSPDAEHPLASGSTLARFQYAYTRRQAALPLEERAVLLE